MYTQDTHIVFLLLWKGTDSDSKVSSEEKRADDD